MSHVNSSQRVRCRMRMIIRAIVLLVLGVKLVLTLAPPIGTFGFYICVIGLVSLICNIVHSIRS
jgi:hypothetical protein